MKEKAETVETEFRESMSHRLEQGYILPGQADLLFSSKTILADAHTPHTIFMTGLDQRPPRHDSEGEVQPDRKET